MSTISTLSRRLAVGAAVAAAFAVVLSGCSAPTSDPDGTPAPGSTPAAPDLGTCGTVPDVGANDPNGLFADLPSEITARYNLYPLEIKESAWRDYASDKTEGFTAALVGSSPGAPFIAKMNDAMRAALGEAGIDIVADFVPDSPSNVPLQLQQFNEALSLKPDVIILTAMAPEPAIELAKAAYDAGIPLVAAQVPIDSEHAVTVTRNAVLDVARVTAGTVSAIDGKGSVLRVLGIPGILPTIFADAGIDAILAECPDITVAGEVTGNFQPALAQSEVLKFLATNPLGVDAVVQSGQMGVGIRNAFLDSGLDVPPIADDGASQGFGTWALQNTDYPFYGTTTEAERTGQAAVEVALRILAGEGPTVNHIVTTQILLDRTNLADFADPNGDIQSLADIPGPEGAFLPASELDEFFQNPGN